jgi:hypothetical protein
MTEQKIAESNSACSFVLTVCITRELSFVLFIVIYSINQKNSIAIFYERLVNFHDLVIYLSLLFLVIHHIFIVVHLRSVHVFLNLLYLCYIERTFMSHVDHRIYFVFVSRTIEWQIPNKLINLFLCFRLLLLYFLAVYFITLFCDRSLSLIRSSFCFRIMVFTQSNSSNSLFQTLTNIKVTIRSTNSIARTYFNLFVVL